MPVRNPRSRVLLVTPLLILSLELSLQVLAWTTFHAAQRETSPPDSAAHTVLCVGDSFTYGMGAVTEGGAYPSRLARRLAPADVAVQNAGWPGQNSRDVLLSLSTHLQRHEPDLVYVLVGLNDGWSLPAPVSDDELTRGADPASEHFSWRWRTARLLELVWGEDDAQDVGEPESHASRGDERDPASETASTNGAGHDVSTLQGVWHLSGKTVEFAADGGLTLGTEPRAWREVGERLEIRRADGTWDLVDWSLVDERLVLTPVNGDAPFVLQRGRPEAVAGAWHDALDSVRLGHWRAAEMQLRACLAADIEPIETSVLLARTLVALRREADARDELLPPARAAYATRPDRATGEALLRIALELDDDELTVPLACELLTSQPASEVAVEAARRFGFAPRHRPALLAALEAGARTLPDGNERRALLLRQAAQLCRHSDASHSVRLAVEAWREDGNERATSLLLTRESQKLDALLDEALDASAATPLERKTLHDLLVRAGQSDTGWQAVLSRHLEQIVASCRAAGCEVVLLEYPDATRPVNAVIAATAERVCAPHLETAPAFEDGRRQRPTQPLFVPNGHPNDAGYEILADVVGVDAEDRLGLRKP